MEKDEEPDYLTMLKNVQIWALNMLKIIKERNAMAPIKTSSAKAKGRKHQQYLRDKIMQVWPELEEGDVESRSMGAGGVDLLLSPKARKLVRLSIEAKATRKTPSMSELKQAQANAYPETLPVVAWKPHGKSSDDTMVLTSFEHLLVFIRSLQEER